MVGYNFNLNLDKKGKSYKTTFGGVASLVVLGLLSAYFVTLFLKLLDDSPQQLLTWSSVVVDDGLVASFKTYDFNFRIQIIGKRDYQPERYDIDKYRQYLKFGFTKVGVNDDDTINYSKMEFIKGDLR